MAAPRRTYQELQKMNEGMVRDLISVTADMRKYRDEAAELETERNKLQTKLQTAHNEKKEADETNKQLKLEKKSLETENADLKKEKQTLQEDMDRLNEHLETEHEQATAAATVENEKDKKLHKVERRLSRANSDLQNKDDQLQSRDDELRAERAKLTAKEDALANVEEHLKTSRAKNQRLTDENEILKEQNRKLESEKIDIEQRSANDLNAKTQAYSALETRLKAVSADLEQKNEQADKRSREEARLTEANKLMQDELALREQNIKALNAVIGWLTWYQENDKKIEDEKIKIQADLDQNKQTLATAEQKIEELNSTLAEKEQKVQTLEREKQDSQTQIENQTRGLENLKQERDNKASQLAESEQKLKNLDQQNAQLRLSIQDAGQKLSNSNRENEKTRAERDQAKQALADLEQSTAEEQRKLNETLASKDKSISQLSREKTSLKTKLTETERRATSNNAELERTRRELRGQNEQIAKCCSALSKRGEQMDKELETLDNEMGEDCALKTLIKSIVCLASSHKTRIMSKSEDLGKKTRELAKLNKQLRKCVAALGQRGDDLESQLGSLDNEIQNEGEIKTLTKALVCLVDEQKAENEDKDKSLDEKTDQIAVLHKELEKRDEIISNWLMPVENAVTECNDRKQEVENRLESQVEQTSVYQREMEKYQDENTIIRQDRDRLVDQMQNLSMDIDLAQSDASANQRENEDNKSEVQRLSQLVKDTQLAKNKLESEKTDLENRLRQQIEKTENQTKDLENRLRQQIQKTENQTKEIHRQESEIAELRCVGDRVPDGQRPYDSRFDVNHSQTPPYLM